MRRGPFELAWRATGQGDGPPLLVIGSALYYPRTFSAALQTRRRMVFVDHRGFGRAVADYGPPDYTLDTVIEDVEALRRHLGLGRVVVVGHSGHGYMALEYAKRHAEHVAGVVIIATGPSHRPEHMELAGQAWQEAVCPTRKARFAADMSMLAAEIEAAPEKRFVTFCLRMAARTWFAPDYDAAPLWEGVQANMPVIDHLWGEAFRDIDVGAGLPDLDRPVLLALGRFDYQVASCEAWRPYRPLFRDLTVRVFDRSGHNPQAEEAALFDAELLEWLGEKGLA